MVLQIKRVLNLMDYIPNVTYLCTALPQDQFCLIYNSGSYF